MEQRCRFGTDQIDYLTTEPLADESSASLETAEFTESKTMIGSIKP